MRYSKRILIIGFIGIMLLIVFLVFKSTLNPDSDNENNITENNYSALQVGENIKRKDQSDQLTTDSDEQKANQIRAAFLTPINIIGEVVDEHGIPIVGATVKIGINDKPMKSGSKYIETTDQDGRFLFQSRGLSYSLSASKQGYYAIDKSRDGRTVALDPLPSTDVLRDNPITLVLYQKKNPVSLIHNKSSQIDIPKTGERIPFNLTPNTDTENILLISSVVSDTGSPKYDWEYTISLPDGGLLEKTNKFEFVAPESGYRQSINIARSATDEDWTPRVRKTYFAKLPDGRFAKFKFRIFLGKKRNFVVIDSFVNPEIGNRNLEDKQSEMLR